MGMPEDLPAYAPLSQHQPALTKRSGNPKSIVTLLSVAGVALLTLALSNVSTFHGDKVLDDAPHPLVVARFEESIDKCDYANQPAGIPADFHKRTQSDRYDEDLAPDLLIKNATIWTGEDDGNEWLKGASLLLSKGLIQGVYKMDDVLPYISPKRTYEAHGAYLTPGLFDMHSHIGVDSLPALRGADDTNSLQKPVLPYLRSLDGINTHDRSYHRTIAGGVTTSLILPGSANNIGGQAFVIKLRDTKGKTPGEKVLEMPWNVKAPRHNNETYRKGDPVRFRHMKNACGENIMRVYSQTRMDESWNFRSAFDKARSLKNKQDKFCAKAYAAKSKGEILDEEFPDDLEWEALVDVLRGRVKVNVHCYEATDFQAYVDHSNEFGYPVAAFHHAHEAYLVPDLLKQTFGQTNPAVAIFATNARYKREAWRGTEYAAKILNENNLTVIAKSDHPVLDSRYLLFEAQQFHHFGLPANKAIQSVTSNPANTAGFGHRLGYIRPKYDADVVLWDSHPLELGATPLQVIIDGQIQLQDPHSTPKPQSDLQEPFTEPVAKAQDTNPQAQSHRVLFKNVEEVLVDAPSHKTQQGSFDVLVENGKIVCVGDCASLAGAEETIDLENGSILPAFVGFGPALGLVEIIAEKSTIDGEAADKLGSGSLWDEDQSFAVSRPDKAYDGLEFGGKHLTTATENGVKYAITPPMGSGFHHGLSVMFKTGAEHVLEKDAIVKEVVAMHVSIGHFGSKTPAISTQIGELERLLTSNHDNAFNAVRNGSLPLVINTDKLDVIARLILLKEKLETSSSPMRWIVNGGAEAHLIAKEIAKANIAVILNPPRQKPDQWDGRRVLDGLPLTQQSALVVLEEAGVLVAIGVPEEWQIRHLLWEAAWQATNAGGKITRKQAVDWISRNFAKMFNVEISLDADFIAYKRDPFRFGSAIAWTS